ncbi:MAG: Wadjet anti-phage system protein JetA family protein, partial [Candidatus Enteromonas sp.]|nr:Wadjet anti-phage system protein JetA family protein [Candidatus Enteromonas sp.]
MKNLFDVINPKMFSVFARDDRRSNYEILSMIYRLYTRDGLSDTLDKDDIHFALMRYFQTHVFDDLEDENGISINNASIREKARIKVRQFKKAGWLEEDNTEGFRTTIGLNDCALAMLELFDEMVDRFDRPLEYSGYFYTIYSLLLDFNDYKQSKARLEQVFTNTRYLFNGLQGLNSSIKRFIQQLMDDNQSTPEVVLHNLLVKYREQVLVTVFNNLKSKDSPDRYVSFILDKLRKIRYEDFDVMFEGYLASLNEVPLPDRELALKEELIEKLDDTIDRFMAVDGFVNAIDARNTKYHDAALSKIKFLMNNGRDITGLVDNALKSLKIEGRVPD